MRVKPSILSSCPSSTTPRIPCSTTLSTPRGGGMEFTEGRSQIWQQPGPFALGLSAEGRVEETRPEGGATYSWRGWRPCRSRPGPTPGWRCWPR